MNLKDFTKLFLKVIAVTIKAVEPAIPINVANTLRLSLKKLFTMVLDNKDNLFQNLVFS